MNVTEATTLVLAAQMALCGCRQLERFDTGERGAYCGSVVAGDFTRRGFAPGLRLRLTLDMAALQVSPGTLQTDDQSDGPCSPLPTFDRAPMRVTRELFADALAGLDLGPGHDFSFVAWVDSTCRGSAMAIVSLMHSGNVEVRLLARAPLDDAESSGHFAVFPLERTDCSF